MFYKKCPMKRFGKEKENSREKKKKMYEKRRKE